MILSAIAEKLKRRSKDDLSGRGAGYPAPPPQIPACGFPAPGSCRRSNVIDVRGLGGPFRFDPRIGASCDTPKPALCSGRASASTSSSDWSLPSALSATAPHGFVRGFLQYYGPIRLLACSPTASPS